MAKGIKDLKGSFDFVGRLKSVAKVEAKEAGKNGKMYTTVLIVYNELVSVSTSKDEDKAKLSCIKQYKDEIKKKREC